MLKEINMFPIALVIAGILFIFVVINAWHLRILWNEEDKQFYFHYRILHLVHEINHRDHWEFEERKSKLPKILNIFKWKKTK